MKKKFNLYLVAWVILLAVYNLVVFFVRALPGYEIRYDARFWVSWGVVIASFLGQLLCARVAFQAENKEKLFLNIPLIRGSYSSLILMVVLTSIIMLIPDCPVWIVVIVCAITLGFSAISLVKATAAAELVGEIDTRIKAQTFFIKMLTADAESLAARAQDEAVKAEVKKVYEAIRFSDPMSNEALSGVEQQISEKFAELSAAVDAADAEAVKQCADRLVQLTTERNNKCKALK